MGPGRARWVDKASGRDEGRREIMQSANLFPSILGPLGVAICFGHNELHSHPNVVTRSWVVRVKEIKERKRTSESERERDTKRTFARHGFHVAHSLAALIPVEGAGREVMFCCGGLSGSGQDVTSTAGTASDLARSYTRLAASKRKHWNGVRVSPFARTSSETGTVRG